jgi:hypothetical protein
MRAKDIIECERNRMGEQTAVACFKVLSQHFYNRFL